MVDDHLYTLDITQTLLATTGGVVSLVLAVLLGLRQLPPGQGRRWAPPVVAACALVASVLAASGSPPDAIAAAFPGVYALDRAAVGIAGIAALVIALRARSMISLAVFLPVWLLAQCGVVHARSLHHRLPRIADLAGRPVQVGGTRREIPVVLADEVFAVNEVVLQPRERGTQDVRVHASAGEGQLGVERMLHFEAVEERGEPLLPLAPGNRWLLRSANGHVDVSITVGESVIEDGLNLHTLTVVLDAHEKDDEHIRIGGNPLQVYEADGQVWLLPSSLSWAEQHSAKAKGEVFLTHGDSRGGPDAIPCRIATLDQCTCAAEVSPPTRLLPGPVRCQGRYIKGLGEGVLAIMAIPLGLLSTGKADTTAFTIPYDVELVSSGPSSARGDP
jgi:hypothetical protein